MYRVRQGSENSKTELKTTVHKAVPLLTFNPLKDELNPICHLLELLGAHPILHVSRIRVKNRASYI